MVIAVVGGSGLVYAVFVLGLAWPWPLVAVLAALLLVLGRGSYEVWDEADHEATRWTPNWEICLDRATDIRALYRTRQFSLGDGENPRPLDHFNAAERADLLATYMSNQFQAAQRAYDYASEAGFPLNLEREALREPTIVTLPGIADAFDDAARRWRESVLGNDADLEP